MGMYTEFFYRAKLIEDVDPRVIELLQWKFGCGKTVSYVLPDDEFFLCQRWNMLFRGTSAYFPESGLGSIRRSGWGEPPGQWLLVVHSSIKNYDHEIEKFCDWIDPYVDAAGDGFLGYSLYEEAENPTLIWKARDEKPEDFGG